VKLYGADVESGGVKLNEVVEFIGVLEADPSADFDAPAARDAAAFGMSESEVAALCPPPSRVPRLHCLLHRRLSATDEVIEYAAAARAAEGRTDEGIMAISSAVADASASSATPVVDVPTAEDFASAPGSAPPKVRAMVLAALTSALGGDDLAAEYVLLAACAKVVARVDGMPLGCFPLHLMLPPLLGGADHEGDAATMQEEEDSSFSSSRIDGGDTEGSVVKALANCVANLWPRSRYLELTEERLRGQGLLPRKDYATNRLQTSPLQLAAHTVLVVDETRFVLICSC